MLQLARRSSLLLLLLALSSGGILHADLGPPPGLNQGGGLAPPKSSMKVTFSDKAEPARLRIPVALVEQPGFGTGFGSDFGTEAEGAAVAGGNSFRGVMIGAALAAALASVVLVLRRRSVASATAVLLVCVSSASLVAWADIAAPDPGEAPRRAPPGDVVIEIVEGDQVELVISRKLWKKWEQGATKR